MTTDQLLSFLIAPAGGLMIAAILLFLTRHERRGKHG
jgi:hypothetical protein